MEIQYLNYLYELIFLKNNEQDSLGEDKFMIQKYIKFPN